MIKEKYSYEIVNDFYQIIYNNYPVLYIFITDSCVSYNKINGVNVATIDTILSIYYALSFLNIKSLQTKPPRSSIPNIHLSIAGATIKPAIGLLFRHIPMFIVKFVVFLIKSPVPSIGSIKNDSSCPDSFLKLFPESMSILQVLHSSLMITIFENFISGEFINGSSLAILLTIVLIKSS
jgi:hypothetical protein